MQQAQWSAAEEAYGRALWLGGWRGTVDSAATPCPTTSVSLYAEDVAELHNRRGLALYKMGTPLC